MPQIEQSIVIQASPAAVFNVIAHEPERMPEWWTALEIQQRVTPPPTAAGSIAHYVYNMLGMRIKGEHQVLVYEVPEHLVVRTVSGIDSMFDFSLAAQGEDATQLTVRVAYTLPGSVLGHLINRRTIEQENEQVVVESLNNLKTLVEAEAALNP